MKTVVVKPEIPDAIKAEFSHLPDIVSKLLFYRGISTKNEAEAFLSGEYKTHDPFLMKDMEKATKRIVGAIKSNEKIFIFSDYDADGIPGAVVLSDFFRKINFSNFEVYIPNRDAEGFGLKVLYYDVLRNENFEKDCEAVFYESVDDVLKNSDVVCLAVPLLDSTRHLINKDRLKMMKKTAYLINTARGPVVDEKALVEALKNKTIAGAGLDVFENEPELADGLTDLENVVLTPHIASATTRARNEMAEIVANNLIDFKEGRVPRNKIVAK
jgi:translation elongation factor EF-1beta